jgi:hypothetical protein
MSGDRSRRKAKGRRAPGLPAIVVAPPMIAAPAMADDVAGNDSSGLPVLAFWARNMAPIRARGRIWPGFDYSEAEWRRLLELAGIVPSEAFSTFQIATAALMIAAIALVAVGGGVIIAPLYQMIPPAWMQAGLLGLLVAIPIAIFLLFGYGFPLAIRLAAAFAMNDAMHAQISAASGDADLAAKIPRQFRRVAAFAGGVLFVIAASETYLPEPAQHWAAIAIAIGSGIVALLWL